MLDLDENLRTLNELKSKLQILEDTIKISNLKEELKALQNESSSENFWQDAQKSSMVYSKIKVIQRKIEKFENIQNELENLIELNSLLSEEKDETLELELESNTNKLNKDLETLQIETLFSGKYDVNNAIITLHPGAGRNRISRLGRNVI
jgi:peptide chain release factor 2